MHSATLPPQWHPPKSSVHADLVCGHCDGGGGSCRGIYSIIYVYPIKLACCILHDFPYQNRPPPHTIWRSQKTGQISSRLYVSSSSKKSSDHMRKFSSFSGNRHFFEDGHLRLIGDGDKTTLLLTLPWKDAHKSHQTRINASLTSTVLPARSPFIETQTYKIPSSLIVECFEVQGSRPLMGHVELSGAKNSALAVLAGALCTSEVVRLRMIPDLHDIRQMFQVLQSIGVELRQDSSGITVDARNITSMEPDPDVVRKLRASFFVIGALVGRYGEAVVPLPGGCNIGARPIDLHIRGLEALGANVEVRQGKVHAQVANGKRLVGGRFCLDYPSVGATETLMMAAALADGKTVLSNVAQEPEVVDLAEFLNSCGANIEGSGTSVLVIKGANRLHGSDFRIIPDRIEAGTFLMAAAITRSVVSMSPVIPRHLTSVIGKLESIGCVIYTTYPTCLKINASQRLTSSYVKTQPFPGFPTDLQPQLTSLLTTCDGTSIIKETVFESRMRHVEELQKLGAKVRVCRNMAFINGGDEGSSLYGAAVTAMDLRGGASLVLAGMAAEGVTHIEGVHHIDRGYERFDEKLRAIGTDIQRKPCLPSQLGI